MATTNGNDDGKEQRDRGPNDMLRLGPSLFPLLYLTNVSYFFIDILVTTTTTNNDDAVFLLLFPFYI